MRRQGLRFLSPVWAFFIAASLCAQPAGTPGQVQQSAESPSQPPTGVFDASEGIVKLDVAVTDKSGKPVSGLTSKDFTLLDNGQPQKIVTFHAFDGITVKPDPPVEVILVIDALNLQHQQLSSAEQEVGKFLRENGGKLAQPITIYRLSYDRLLAVPQPSTDGNALATEITDQKRLDPVWPGHNDSPQRPVERSPELIARSRNELSLDALGAIVL